MLVLFKICAALSSDGRFLDGADDNALDVLSHLVEFVVLHHKAEEDDWYRDASSDDQYPGHGFLVCAVDSVASRTTHGPAGRS